MISLDSIQDKPFPVSPKEDLYTSAPVPLYYRIKEYLSIQIDSGALLPGDQIPTEEQLSELFQVSRMTARRAVNDLAREGRLIRRQGIGTFVADPIIERQLTRLTTLSEEMQRLGYTGLHSRILAWRILRSSPPVAKLLGIESKDPILRIRRVRYTGDVPIAVQTIYFPEHLVPGLESQDSEKGSLYQILEGRLHQRIEWARQRIEAVAATKFHAKWLDIAPGSPLLKVTRQSFLADGQPLEITKTYYRPDRYSCQINLYRDQG